MKFQHLVLKNGLTIIGEQRLSAVSSALGFFVRTGSRDESPEVAGVSHFLEHMMFKGTKKRTAIEINYELASLGAQANAYTSEENTVYYAAILPENFLAALDLFSDMLRPALVQEEFDMEKKVILEEIALYQDRPSHVVFEAAMKEFFGKHPAGNSVLGTTESISNLSSEQMRNYFNKRYSPSNLVLAASGNFSWEEFVANAESYCGDWQDIKTTRELKPNLPQASQKTIYKESIQRAQLCLVGSSPSAQEEEKYAADILSVILGDSTSSKVYWELVDKGLVDSASIDTNEMDGTGIAVGFASCSPENLEEVSSRMKKIMNSPLAFSEQELEQAVTKYATRVVLQGESSMRRLMSIGSDWTYCKKYLSTADELAKIKNIKRKSLEDLIAKYSFAPLCEVRLLPA